MSTLITNPLNFRANVRQFIRSKQKPAKVVIQEEVKSINNGVFYDKLLGVMPSIEYMASRFGIGCTFQKYTNANLVSVDFSSRDNLVTSATTLNPDNYTNPDNIDDTADIAKIMYEAASNVL